MNRYAPPRTVTKRGSGAVRRVAGRPGMTMTLGRRPAPRIVVAGNRIAVVEQPAKGRVVYPHLLDKLKLALDAGVDTQKMHARGSAHRPADRRWPPVPRADPAASARAGSKSGGPYGFPRRSMRWRADMCSDSVGRVRPIWSRGFVRRICEPNGHISAFGSLRGIQKIIRPQVGPIPVRRQDQRRAAGPAPYHLGCQPHHELGITAPCWRTDSVLQKTPERGHILRQLAVHDKGAVAAQSRDSRRCDGRGWLRRAGCAGGRPPAARRGLPGRSRTHSGSQK